MLENNKMKHGLLFQGACFNTMSELREALKLYAMTNSSPMTTKISRPDYLHVQCFSKRQDEASDKATCDFTVRANKRKDNHIYIAYIQLEHSPECLAIRNASAAAIRQEVAEVLATVPNVRPRSLINLARLKYGVSTSYSTAWRAMQSYGDAVNSNMTTAFSKIPDFLKQLELLNPHSTVECETSSEGIFDWAFLSLGAAKNAFTYCRPIIIAEACHIKNKYGGVIMSVSAYDGDGHIVPLAVGLFSVENEDNWHRFFSKLLQAIPNVGLPGIIVIHDREKGLHEAQRQVLPFSHESICVRHLEENVKAHFKSTFGDLLWEAAKHCIKVKYDETLAVIASRDKNAAEYLLQSNPTRWATCHFPVPRFGTVTSNSAESLNSWMENFCGKSHLRILSCWVSRSARVFYRRKHEYATGSGMLSPQAARLFNEKCDIGRRHQTFQVSENLIEVVNLTTEHTRIVDFSANTCSCGEYQEMQFPCPHVAEAASLFGKTIDQLVHSSYLLSSLQSIYSMHITPVDLDSLQCSDKVLPVVIKKKVGRPRTIQSRSRGVIADGDQNNCNKGGELGHNSQTLLTLTAALAAVEDPVAPKKRRVRTICCPMCHANHYRKTPCRAADKP